MRRMVALGTSLIVLGMAFLLSGLIFLLPKGWIMTRRQVRRDERASSGQAGRLNRSSVLSDVPAKATRVNRAGPGHKVIRLRRLSHTRQYGTDQAVFLRCAARGGVIRPSPSASCQIC